MPLLRWPGGCYADRYHWRDGIGPQAERPIRLGMSCGLQVEDDNSLGTHEFLWLGAQLGAEPYLAGNVGSGSPQELCDWMEYCNTAVRTTLARMRAANSAPQPFGVKLWGVGNENRGCGGHYEATTYGREYVRDATMLRHVDPSAELVVCGHDEARNTEVLAAIGRHLGHVDHVSIHRYWIHGESETNFDDGADCARLAEAKETEAFVRRTAEIRDDATGGRQPIGLVLDEWRVCGGGRGATVRTRHRRTGGHAARRTGCGDCAGRLPSPVQPAVAGQPGADRVNVVRAPVMTDGAQMWCTPTYHALHRYAPHIGAEVRPAEVTAGGGERHRFASQRGACRYGHQPPSPYGGWRAPHRNGPAGSQRPTLDRRHARCCGAAPVGGRRQRAAR